MNYSTRRSWVSFIVVLMFTTLYCLTALATQSPDSHYPVTITNQNYAGEKVEYTYEKAPEKVVVVYQGCIETMIALGLEDHVLASYGLDNEVKDEWKDGFAKMNYKDDVFSPDRETVTLMEPDMIFSWGSFFGEKKMGEIDAWNDKGVGTYMVFNSSPVTPRLLENEYLDLLNIGKIFNVEEKAETLVNEMKDSVTKTLEATKDLAPVKVLVIEPVSDGKFSNYGANSLAGNMVTTLGGELVKPDGNSLSKEDIIACDADVIFVVYMPYGRTDFGTMAEEYISLVADDPILKSVRAVQNNRLYAIQLGEVYASGARTANGLAELAAGMYPEIAK